MFTIADMRVHKPHQQRGDRPQLGCILTQRRRVAEFRREEKLWSVPAFSLVLVGPFVLKRPQRRITGD